MVPPAAAERGETGDAADAPDTKDRPESNIPLLSPPCEPWLMALSTLVTLPRRCACRLASRARSAAPLPDCRRTIRRAARRAAAESALLAPLPPRDRSLRMASNWFFTTLRFLDLATARRASTPPASSNFCSCCLAVLSSAAWILYCVRMTFHSASFGALVLDSRLSVWAAAWSALRVLLRNMGFNSVDTEPLFAACIGLAMDTRSTSPPMVEARRVRRSLAVSTFGLEQKVEYISDSNTVAK
mmetsp:Transcript_64155/g.130369  ORF Transcript_64155/g.130369 Transcript_64155/m.130369 type:complete len:243 (+) Transcript_64155:640-1368(+)